MEEKTEYTAVYNCRHEGTQAQCYQTGYVNDWDTPLTTVVLVLVLIRYGNAIQKVK